MCFARQFPSSTNDTPEMVDKKIDEHFDAIKKDLQARRVGS